ncbi:MAG: serine/threonine protein kinase [Planctomycetes bacterium]|nr:serine/threonine protein kinase [Planctomycetota bacterium]
MGRERESDPPPAPRQPSAGRREEDTVLATAGAAETRTETARGNAGPATPALPAPGCPVLVPVPAAAGQSFGRYRLLDHLGQGGMGTVWKAWDGALGRTVALKQLLYEGPGTGRAVERFLREARLAARLSHPHIVPIFDVGAIDGRHYLTMAYVEGRTFAAALTESSSAKRGSAAARAESLAGLRAEIGVLADVTEAVAFAHAAGVVHRDLKPANILLDLTGRPFVTDFGLAQEVAPPAGPTPPGTPAPRLTGSGQALGTPAYMSPEQAHGDLARIGPRSDVWSLGVILYELLTGAVPFSGSSPWDVLAEVVGAEPQRPRARNPHAPAELEAVCLLALEKDPARRYAGADDFAAELRRWLHGEPVRARRHTLAYRVARWSVRRRAPLLAAAAAALCLLAMADRQWRQARAHADATRDLLGEVERGVSDFERTVMRSSSAPEIRRAFARHTLGLLDRLVADAPALGPAYAWRGRLLETIGERARADEDYDRGCAQAPASAMVWLLRGQSRVARVLATRRAPFAFSDSGRVFLRLPKEEDPAEAARCAAGLADLEQMVRLASADPDLGERRLRIGRAMAAAARGRPEDWPVVLSLLSGLEEPQAQWLRGLALCYLGRLDEAGPPLDASLQEWSCYPQALETRALVRVVQAARGAAPGSDPSALLAGALTDLDLAVAVTPSSDLRRCLRAAVLVKQAELGLSRDADPRPCIDRAVDECADVLRRSALFVQAYEVRANGLRVRAEQEARHDVDARPTFLRAEADLSEVVRLSPGDGLAYYNRGVLRARGAREERRHGGDERPALRAAAEDFEEALLRGGEPSRALCGLGTARVDLGEAEARHGGDVVPLARAAVSDLTRALERDPGLTAAFFARGAAWHDLALVEQRARRDPGPAYAQAESDLRAAVARGSPAANLRLGMVLCGQGRLPEAMEAFEAAGRDAPETAAEARERWAQVRAQLDRAVPRWFALLSAAEDARERRDDAAAAPRYDEGLALLDEALRKSPQEKASLASDPDMRAFLARVRYHCAALEARRSLGGAAPTGMSATIEPEADAAQAATHRERALEHLRAAREWGFDDPERARRDPDLAPLRADPRFEESLRPR